MSISLPSLPPISNPWKDKAFHTDELGKTSVTKYYASGALGKDRVRMMYKGDFGSGEPEAIKDNVIGARKDVDTLIVALQSGVHHMDEDVGNTLKSWTGLSGKALQDAVNDHIVPALKQMSQGHYSPLFKLDVSDQLISGGHEKKGVISAPDTRIDGRALRGSFSKGADVTISATKSAILDPTTAPSVINTLVAINTANLPTERAAGTNIEHVDPKGAKPPETLDKPWLNANDIAAFVHEAARHLDYMTLNKYDRQVIAEAVSSQDGFGKAFNRPYVTPWTNAEPAATTEKQPETVVKPPQVTEESRTENTGTTVQHQHEEESRTENTGTTVQHQHEEEVHQPEPEEAYEARMEIVKLHGSVSLGQEEFQGLAHEHFDAMIAHIDPSTIKGKEDKGEHVVAGENEHSAIRKQLNGLYDLATYSDGGSDGGKKTQEEIKDHYEAVVEALLEPRPRKTLGRE